MLQITKNDNELLKNYPFLKTIDKLKSSHASENLTDRTWDINCWTKHDCYLACVYSEYEIDRDYYSEILVDFLLRKLEAEARNTMYSNAFSCYNSEDGDFTVSKLDFNDRLILEKYNADHNSKFRRTTVMYIREPFEEWNHQYIPSLNSLSDFDKKLNEELKIHFFSIKGRFGFQNLLNKTIQERKKIEHIVFTSTDIMPFALSELKILNND